MVLTLTAVLPIAAIAHPVGGDLRAGSAHPTIEAHRTATGLAAFAIESHITREVHAVAAQGRDRAGALGGGPPPGTMLSLAVPEGPEQGMRQGAEALSYQRGGGHGAPEVRYDV